MHSLRSLLLLAALALAGCDRISGEADKKIYDAEAIGYACRVSLKAPEDCMKENETQSPTSVLDGWKAANKDIEKGVIDPTMGKRPASVIHAPQSAVAETATNADTVKMALPDLKAVAKAGTATTEKPAKH
ncbi:MAG TPA: hypothetical protein VFW59_08825 [Gallionella sp.]|nr:hypothetical protein [Gallionella sp.]